MLVSTSESSTVIDDAAAADGTFFTLWIGNNDILGYASSGGSGVDNNETGAGPALRNNSITNNNTFAGVYASLVAKMTANGAKVLLINITITSLPFFTTVPSAPFDQKSNLAAQIPSLNAFYAELNQAFTAHLVFQNVELYFSTTAEPCNL
jgi:hypothetical protein